MEVAFDNEGVQGGRTPVRVANGLSPHEKMLRTVIGAYLLAGRSHESHKVSQTAQAVDVSLPAMALDPISTIVVLTTR
jgi:hypothetical protein